MDSFSTIEVMVVFFIFYQILDILTTFGGTEKILSTEQTCSTVVLVKPSMKGSKNSERFCISAEVTNLKNITTTKANLSRHIKKMRSRHLKIGTGFKSLTIIRY